jgi:hypothetical protein
MILRRVTGSVTDCNQTNSVSEHQHKLVSMQSTGYMSVTVLFIN